MRADLDTATQVRDLGIILAWEKGRILFNFIIAAVAIITLATTSRPLWEIPGLWRMTGLFFIFMNVSYFVGPVLNGYARISGFRGPAVMPFLFVMLTLLLAFLDFAALRAISAAVSSRLEAGE